MSLESAFQKAEAEYKAVIMEDTWGHLAPKPQTKYTGYVLFTHGCHGDITVIDYEFNDPGHNELPGSPWLAQDILNELMNSANLGKEGSISLFEGTYTKFKNGNCRFSGKICEVSAYSFRAQMKRK